MSNPPPTRLPIQLRLATCSHQHGASMSDGGTIELHALLAACEPVYRQMRVDAGEPVGEDDAAAWSALQSRMASDPLHLIVALQGGSTSLTVLGLTAVRVEENTFHRTRVLIEVMHTDAQWRSRGIGRAMINGVNALAERCGVKDVTCQVDSQATEAQRFFMRERLTIQAFAFRGSSATDSRIAEDPQPAAAAATAPVSAIGSHPTATEPSGLAFATAVTTGAGPGCGDGGGNSGGFESASADRSAPVYPDPPAFDVRVLTAAESRTITHEGLLLSAERVHRQLHAHLTEHDTTAEYVERMRRIAADGSHIAVAVARPSPCEHAVPQADSACVVLGVSVYRFRSSFLTGRLSVWVDDLVTDGARRSCGVGAALLHSIRLHAQQLGAADVQLDSAVYRSRAHKFYFSQGMILDAFSFAGSSQQLPQRL